MNPELQLILNLASQYEDPKNPGKSLSNTKVNIAGVHFKALALVTKNKKFSSMFTEKARRYEITASLLVAAASNIEIPAADADVVEESVVVEDVIEETPKK